MRDSDPRPMPPVVKAAYRNPIDLLGLLGSDVYSDSDRKRVRDSLLEALNIDFGVVHLPHGEKQTRTVSQRAKSIKDPIRSIDFILAVEDYGGKDQTQSYLARAMETRWQEWWSSMGWKDPEDYRSIELTFSRVIGRRQMVWLASQYARTAIEFAYTSASSTSFEAIEAIEAAESWAVNPTQKNRETATDAQFSAGNAVASYSASDNLAWSAACASAWAAAYAAAYSGSAAVYARVSADGAAETAAYLGAAAPAYSSRLCELTKQLITPSLVDAI